MPRPPSGLWWDQRRTYKGIIRIRTAKRAGNRTETRKRRRGQFFANRGSRRILVCDEFADMDCARLRTDCGHGLFADTDRLRLRFVCGLFEVADLPRSRPCAINIARLSCVFTATHSRTQKPCQIKG